MKTDWKKALLIEEIIHDPNPVSARCYKLVMHVFNKNSRSSPFDLNKVLVGCFLIYVLHSRQ